MNVGDGFLSHQASSGLSACSGGVLVTASGGEMFLVSIRNCFSEDQQGYKYKKQKRLMTVITSSAEKGSAACSTQDWSKVMAPVAPSSLALARS